MLVTVFIALSVVVVVGGGVWVAVALVKAISHKHGSADDGDG